MSNTTDEFYARIERLYKELKPLQDEYGLKPKTIEQRFEEHKLKQEALLKIRTKPKWFNNV
jgi:hypothetical protein